ncbi:uncharacterized protein LOC141754163 [Sebastes fasciatus]|uniref:uncharacterized protein LOC141754162 n=1 Tax=Sebastes fasciatus TaxID=394691 RepID=UPI003D9E2698
MNLWLISHFLVAGLFLSSSALTPEECQPLVTPLSLADPSMMLGLSNFMAGYSDNKVYNAILKLTQSSSMNITESPSNPSEVVMSQKNRINGTCSASTSNVIFDGNTASVSIANVTSMFHLLPTCDGCMLFSINVTARNLDKLLHKIEFNHDVTEEEIHAHALYLMGPGSTLKDSDLEHFKQQASCFGFSGEPDFLYDPKNGLCAEGEGIKMTL